MVLLDTFFNSQSYLKVKTGYMWNNSECVLWHNVSIHNPPNSLPVIIEVSVHRWMLMSLASGELTKTLGHLIYNSKSNEEGCCLFVTAAV